MDVGHITPQFFDTHLFNQPPDARQEGEQFASGHRLIRGKVMEKHFVSFYSPGSFMDEETELPIESWDVEAASEMAHTIKERHNATPHMFIFNTRARGEDDLDSKVVKVSAKYHLGGTLSELNGEKVVDNCNSWKHTARFSEGDVILDWKPREAA